MKMIETIFYKPAKYDYDKIVKCLNLLTNCTEDEDCFYRDIFKSERPISSLGIIHGKIGEIVLCIYFPCEDDDENDSYIDIVYKEEDNKKVNEILKIFEWLEFDTNKKYKKIV